MNDNSINNENSNSLNDNNINNKPEITNFNNTKKSINKKPTIPIILSILIIIFIIPFIKDAFFIEHEGWGALSVIADIYIFIIGGSAIGIIWVIYLITLAISKKKSGVKKWWIPLWIANLIVAIPIVILISLNIIMNYKNNHQIFTNDKPEIVSYEKLSDIPLYDDYIVLGEDLSEYDVYNDINKYRGEKVLVKGIPSYRGSTGTYGNTETVNIFNENDQDMVLYRFTFVDNESEFANDNYIFFSNGDTSLDDYYTYIYGKILSIQNYFFAGEDYKVINIEPEKIYYTLKWDTMFIKEDKIIYSECAKVGNQCNNEDILNGQVVNISVNDTENLDFYVISDDGQNLTLYGYEALDTIPYLSESDTEELLTEYNEPRNIYDDSIDYYMDNYWGPYTLMKKLNELTSSWTNISPIKEYTYYTNVEDIFKSLEIKNGISTITSANGNKVTIPGTSVARIVSESDIADQYNVPEFYGKSCLRTIGIRKGSNCESWSIDAGIHGQHFGNSISSSYENNYEVNLVTTNIHEKNYLVPVIEVSKDKINDK